MAGKGGDRLAKRDMDGESGLKGWPLPGELCRLCMLRDCAMRRRASDEAVFSADGLSVANRLGVSSRDIRLDTDCRLRSEVLLDQHAR